MKIWQVVMVAGIVLAAGIGFGYVLGNSNSEKPQEVEKKPAKEVKAKKPVVEDVKEEKAQVAPAVAPAKAEQKKQETASSRISVTKEEVVAATVSKDKKPTPEEEAREIRMRFVVEPLAEALKIQEYQKPKFNEIMDRFFSKVQDLMGSYQEICARNKEKSTAEIDAMVQKQIDDYKAGAESELANVLTYDQLTELKKGNLNPTNSSTK